MNVQELPASCSLQQQIACLRSLQPALLRGLLSSWPAVQAWSGVSGLQRMVQLAGDTSVQVMSSDTDVFFGDIGQHQPESMTFRSFASLAAFKGPSQHTGGTGIAGSQAAGCTPSKNGAVESCTVASSMQGTDKPQPAALQDGASSSSRRYYLAQATISGVEQQYPTGLHSSPEYEAHQPPNAPPEDAALEHGPQNAAKSGTVPSAASMVHSGGLSALTEDFSMPAALVELRPDSLQTNLWMSVRGSRSSLHYDPYQNLLCCVRGAKRVVLHAPGQGPRLYPRPLHGEAPNHSAVDFTQPDLERHPLYPLALAESLVADLQAGDALFLPEGWWHQVDSEEVSVAVNFWWHSPASAHLAAAASPFHLRQVVRMLGDQRLQQWIASIRPMPLPALAAEIQRSTYGPDPTRHKATQQLAIPEDAHLAAAYRAFFASDTAYESESMPTSNVSQPASRSASRVAISGEEAVAFSMLVVAVDCALANGGLGLFADGCGRHSSDMSTDQASCETSESGASESSSDGSESTGSDCSGEDETIRDAMVARIPLGASISTANQVASLQQSDVRPSRRADPDGGCGGSEGSDAGSGGSVDGSRGGAQGNRHCDRVGGNKGDCSSCGGKLGAGVPSMQAPQDEATAQLGLQHPITRVLAALQAGPLCRVLLALAVRAPATLQGLLLHALPPAGAEVLLGRLEAAQVELSAMQTHGDAFYNAVYAVAPDRRRLLDSLLRGKERCCQAACRQVATESLGPHLA